MTVESRARPSLSRLFADLIEVVEPTLDAREIARRVHRLLLRALAVDLAGIYLAQPDGALYAVEASLSELSLDERRITFESPHVAQLARERRPLRLAAREHPNAFAAKILEGRGVTRLVIAPLSAGTQFLGMLVACRTEGRDLDDLTDDVLDALGRVVGVALEHARLLEDARARAAADRALLDAARVAAAGGALDATLAKYCEALALAAGATDTTITLPVPGTQQMRLAASYGASQEELAAVQAEPMPVNPAIFAEAIRTRRLMTLDLAGIGNVAARAAVERRGFTKVFLVPLLSKDAVKGFASIVGVTAIEPSRAAVVEAVGHEIALAIEAAEEREAARRRAEREAFDEALRAAVRTSFDLPAILQRAVENLGRFLGAARCYVAAGVASRGLFCVTHEFRGSDALPSALDWRFDGEMRPIKKIIHEEGEVVVDDLLADPRIGGPAGTVPCDLRAFIVESFIVGDAWRGVITVGVKDAPRRWTDEEVRLVRQVADHCAMAARRAELHEDARRRASELELTISQMTDGVVMCNERLEVIRANAAARELLWGIPMDRSGTEVMTVHDPDGRAVAPEDFPIVRSVRFGEVVRDRELLLRHKPSGRERSIVSSASPLHDATGRLVGAVVVMKDVTEARRAAANASRTEKLRVVGELAASVAHDINNTLAAVLGSAELIAASALKPEVRHNAGVIAQAARDASVILARLTRLSQRSHAQVARDLVDLAQVADDAIELTRARWGRPGSKLAVVLDAAAGPVRVRGLASELREVFTNLILNSMDAMPDGGTIRVRVAREGGSALAEVHDEGTGMSPDVLRHAFEPFFTTKGDTGTGLGLSISSAIVAGHGGRMDADSAPGGGTRMRVFLPLEAAPPPAARVAAQRILVVDDDARVRGLLVDLLASEGHQVSSASSGEEALAILEKDPAAVSVLVTDFLMPGISGLALAETARERSPRLGIVVVSGFFGGDAPAERLEKLGARVVPKPFRSEDVHAAVAAVTQR